MRICGRGGEVDDTLTVVNTQRTSIQLKPDLDGNSD